MPENESPQRVPVEDIQARLNEVATLLRRPGNVDAGARQALADLVEELGQALRTTPVPAEEVAHLAGTTAHLAEALHHGEDEGWLTRAQGRFEEAAARAEAQAPVAVGLARRLLDVLAQMGI